MDAKAIALLGHPGRLRRRPAGAEPGVAGFEPVFFLLIPAGRVLRSGLRVRAGGGDHRRLRPHHRGDRSVAAVPDVGRRLDGLRRRLPAAGQGEGRALLLAGYAAVSAVLYGALLNLWFWPFGAGTTTSFSFAPGAGILQNLHRFIFFDLTTSLGFDFVRALTNATLVLLLGRPVLAALRRASRRAAFDAEVVYDGPGVSGPAATRG